MPVYRINNSVNNNIKKEIRKIVILFIESFFLKLVKSKQLIKEIIGM